MVESGIGEESGDLKDDENVKNDEFVDLPVLRGRHMPVEGAGPSWIDVGGDQANFDGKRNLSTGSVGYERRGQKLENDQLKEKRRCVEKVMLVTETVYDTVIQCHHSYHKRCHTTYVTGNIASYSHKLSQFLS